MIAAVDHGLAARGDPRQPDRGLHRLGAGLEEPRALGAGIGIRQTLRDACFQRRRQRAYRPVASRAGRGLGDRGIAVA